MKEQKQKQKSKNPAACPRCGKVVGVNYNKGQITTARHKCRKRVTRRHSPMAGLS